MFCFVILVYSIKIIALCVTSILEVISPYCWQEIFLAEVLIVRNNPPTLANFKILISSWRVFLFYFAARRLGLTSKY